MNDKLSNEELMALDIGTYNSAKWLSWRHENPKEKRCPLRTCKHCGRLYGFSCICPEGIEDWEKIIQEIKEVNEFYA